jgi:hypothetical protein
MLRAEARVGQPSQRAAERAIDSSVADGVMLRPDHVTAQAIEQMAVAAADVVGDNHWLAGAVHSSHLTLRSGLEPYRSAVPAGDPLVANYAAALCTAVRDAGPHAPGAERGRMRYDSEHAAMIYLQARVISQSAESCVGSRAPRAGLEPAAYCLGGR